MSEQDAICPHCGASAQGHYLDQCRDNLKRQRQDARELAWLALNKLRENAHVSGDLARILAAEEVMEEFIRRCPWLKERPTVDEP